jgi:dUTPase
MIKFRVKRLTKTAKLPERANDGDLWDLFCDGFQEEPESVCAVIPARNRILVKTGISLELPKQIKSYWFFENEINSLCETHYKQSEPKIEAYAVADLRPRSGLALKHGITVLNAPATIDNSYRKEIGVILINHGHDPYTIRKGDKIAQMLIRKLEVSEFEEVKEIDDTGRGGYGSTGK